MMPEGCPVNSRTPLSDAVAPRRPTSMGRPRPLPRARWLAAIAAAVLLVGAAVGLQAARGALPWPPGAASTSFGALPQPRLAPPDESVGAAPGQPLPYFGPAALTVTARVPALPARLPVWQFEVPSASALDRLAAGHQGRAIRPADPNYREPLIFIDSRTPAPAGAGPAADVARPAADDFLRQRGLTPAWPFEAGVVPYGQVTMVRYLRRFSAPGTPGADQVDAHGAPAGAIVVVAANRSVLQATVPAPVAMAERSYPSAGAGAARAGALAAAPPAPGGLSPRPAVELSGAQLVYVAVAAGSHGYFEPALLFTGQFTVGATRYEKRVLGPALDAASLGRS